MNQRQRILILSDQCLFAEAIRSLLGSQAEVEILADKAYSQATLEQIKKLTPDVVFLGDDERLPTTFLPALLDAMPGIPVVRMSLWTNEIHVDIGRRLMLSQTQDLIDFLKSLQSHSHPPVETAPNHEEPLM